MGDRSLKPVWKDEFHGPEVPTEAQLAMPQRDPSGMTLVPTWGHPSSAISFNIVWQNTGFLGPLIPDKRRSEKAQEETKGLDFVGSLYIANRY